MASFFVPRSVRNKEKQQVCPRDKDFSSRGLPRKENPTPVLIDFTAKTNKTSSKDDQIRELSEIYSIPGERDDTFTEENSSDDEEVVSFSKNQRWPTTGEPVCVVCGRYGAYVCDQTDEDVCSLECKSRHLRDRQKQNTRPSDPDLPLRDSKTAVVGTDYCFPVKHSHVLSNNTKNSLSNQRSTTSEETSVSKESSQMHGFAYREHTTLAALTLPQVEQIRKNLEIQVKGEDVTKPILEFFHCQFPETLAENLQKSGYVTPTPVQMQVIPAGLQGRDVLACAQTGSGKTAAFLLPAITKIHSQLGKMTS